VDSRIGDIVVMAEPVSPKPSQASSLPYGAPQPSLSPDHLLLGTQSEGRAASVAK
jgi:hypothetical protein